MGGSNSTRPGAVLGTFQFTGPNVVAFVVTCAVTMSMYFFKKMPFLEALGNTAMLLGLFMVAVLLPLRIVDAVRYLRGLRTLALLANTSSVNPAILNQLLTLTAGTLAPGGNPSGGETDTGADGQSR